VWKEGRGGADGRKRLEGNEGGKGEGGVKVPLLWNMDHIIRPGPDCRQISS